MAKAARGLPDNFSLDLPDEGPVVIGDFLDEAPPVHVRKAAPADTAMLAMPVGPKPVQREMVQHRHRESSERVPPNLGLRSSQQPPIIRYQLNLSPKSKRMLEELVEHVCKYSPESDARTSEVFQGIVTLLHGAMDELELAELPRRGAWGSVTAKSFPVALSWAFEQAILRSAQNREDSRRGLP